MSSQVGDHEPKAVVQGFDLRSPRAMIEGGAMQQDDRPTTRGTRRSGRRQLVVLALTLIGFGVTSLIGAEPAWAAIGGVTVLVARALTQRRGCLEQVLHDNLDLGTPEDGAGALRLVALATHACTSALPAARHDRFGRCAGLGWGYRVWPGAVPRVRLRASARA
jgi:hypothetical protein